MWVLGVVFRRFSGLVRWVWWVTVRVVFRCIRWVAAWEWNGLLMEQDQLCNLAGYSKCSLERLFGCLCFGKSCLGSNNSVPFNSFFLTERTIFLWRLKVSFIYIFLYGVFIGEFFTFLWVYVWFEFRWKFFNSLF